MIKSNHRKNTVATKFDLPKESLELCKDLLVFPFDVSTRNTKRELADMERNLSQNASDIVFHKRLLTETRRAAKMAQVSIAKLKTTLVSSAPASVEKARAEVESLAKLPWIESVELGDASVIVRTRKGVLKTTFDTRVVECPEGVVTEFMTPVTEELPQYDIFLNLESVGGSLANEPDRLAIRLVNEKDASEFLAWSSYNHQPQSHWASTGTARVMNWEKLCLGEYEKEAVEASKQGLAPFFSELAIYLQTAGDEHAYRRKELWALWLGKPEYNKFCIRVASKGESKEDIEKKYRIDFKERRQPEIREGAVVNPGPVAETSWRRLDFISLGRPF